MAKFTSETAREAGKKSKRQPDSDAEKIRKALTKGTFDNDLITKYFTEIKTLRGKSFIDAANNLFKNIVPQIKAVEFTPPEGDESEFRVQIGWVKTDNAETE